MPFFKNLRHSLVEFLEAFLIGGATILLVFWLVGQPLEVTGDSMTPNFANGEQILAEKLSLRFNDPKRGDVVIIRHPDNKRVFAIKRVIGIPGDTIYLSDGGVFINNQALEEPYLANGMKTWPNTFLREETPLEIPEGSYLVFGDNREVSLDSRSWGYIPREDIVGKPALVYMPISQMRIVQ